MATWPPEETVGWPAYFVFLAAGGLLSFGVAAAASVGLFVLPIGAVLFGLAISYAPDVKDRWGLLAGVGAVGMLVGVLNFDYQPCREGWVVIVGDEDSYSCGGFNGKPFLVVGVLLVVVSLIMYHRRRTRTSTG